MKTSALIAALILMATACGYAADWQWPAQLDLGGFQVVGVQGTVNANGSGTGTGTLQIPNLGNTNISLARNPRGDISGAASLDVRVSGGSLRGNFTLSASGLRGRGTLVCCSRSIDNANFNVDSRGEAKGSGNLSLGSRAVAVDFAVSNSSCSLSGESPVTTQVDTPIALYKLNGRLNVRCSGGTLSATISGRVERTSKLSNQVTSFNIPATSVDLSSGEATISIGGVSVKFGI